uniref:Endonuclease n=1 Tax=Anthurium amnicola TaxID=1678845 RepID=A0A1D1XKQ0_9ARAE
MFRRTVERISSVVGGALLGAISFYEYEKLRPNLPIPLPTLKPNLASIPKELPWTDWRDTAFNDLFVREAYIVSYNRRLRHPNWVLEHITEETLKRGEGVDRSKSRFLEDLDIPEKFRAKLTDYVKSGYDRGHMAPAGDAKFSQEAMDETFLLSNVAPQVGNGFNRDYWAHFEEFCRRLVYNEGFKDVYLFTGPAYLPKKDENDKWYVKYEMIGSIAVPTHYYKVILAAKDDPSKAGGRFYALGAFLVPNERISDTTPLTVFEVSIDSLERTTGLTFLNEKIIKDAIPLCNAEVSKCIIVANPKHVKEELRSALPEPSKIKSDLK